MSLKFVSSISTTRCQALFGQSAAHRSTINFQVPRMCSVNLHSTQFNTCYHSNDNVSVIIVCDNWTLAHCFFLRFFLSCCIYIYACFFASVYHKLVNKDLYIKQQAIAVDRNVAFDYQSTFQCLYTSLTLLLSQGASVRRTYVRCAAKQPQIASTLMWS